MKFNIEYTNENLQSNTGLVILSKMLNEVNPEPIFRHYGFTNQSTNHFYSDRDVLISLLGLIASGHTSFEHIDLFKNDLLFKKSLGLRGVPSKETLRQRCDELSHYYSPILQVLNDWNFKLLKRYGKPQAIKSTKLIPVDFDVTVMDNTGSHKEGVEKTYQKNVKGFAPMMTNIGSQGYLLDAEFRPGNYHSNCPGTYDYIVRTMNLARRLCPEQTLLARFDSGNDADTNIVALSDYPNSYYIIKHVLRGGNVPKTKEALIERVMKDYTIKQERKGGANYYIAEYEYLASIIDEHDNQIIKNCRRIISVVELTRDINTGQPLLIPYRSLHMWRTNLPEGEYGADEVIELYKDHGTSEQFHSEFKGDMDIERLPSGKYLTNKLIVNLSKIAFNILRIIGHQAIESVIINPGNKLRRIRIRTVLVKIIMVPSRIMRKNKRWTIALPRSNPLSKLFTEIYEII